MSATRAAFTLVAALCACHDLPDLGTCGNGIIEADSGEACDGDISGSADTCSDTCELLCQTTAVDASYVVVSPAGAEEEFCPSALAPQGAMACGLDGVCRASSGQFVSVGSAQPFDIKFGTSGDFDGDGIADLIGTSATQIVVRLGTTGEAFSDGFAQAAPSSDSAITIFDRNPDGAVLDASDMALGVPTDGLALLTSDTEVFGPDLDLTFDVDDASQLPVVVRDPSVALDGSDVLLAVARMGTLTVQRVAISGAHTQLALPTCGPPGSRLVAVATARDLASFVVVGKPLAAGPFFVCRYAPNAGAFQMVQTNFNGVPPDSAVLAQLDNDPCPDVVFARLAAPVGTASIFMAPATPGTCALAGTLAGVGDISETDVLFDAGAIVPNATGPDHDELVLNSGVYQFEGGVLKLVIAPTSDINQWTAASVVDLNSDGQFDVVAGRKGQDDVDIVRGGPIPNAYRADTAAPVVAVTAGDFDGDFLGDVALIEQGLAQRVSILYGTPDGIVAAPVVNSRFGGTLKVGRLRRFTWGGTIRGTDGVDDLVVVQSIAGQTTRGGVMVGDAARLLTVPRIPPVAAPIPIGVVAVGKFDGTKLLAATLRPESRGTPTGRSLLSTNDIAMATAWTDPVIVNGFDVEALRPPATVRTSGSPLIAAFARPTAPAPGAMPTATVGLIDLAANVCTKTLTGVATSVRAADIDGDDGIDELVVNLDSGRSLHVLPVTSGAPCTIGDEILQAAVDGCSDIARVGAHTVVLCEIGVRRAGVFRIGADGVREPNPAISIDGTGIELVTGDFDGDGVLDLAVRVSRAGEVSVQFIKQCPAHDVRGCQ